MGERKLDFKSYCLLGIIGVVGAAAITIASFIIKDKWEYFRNNYQFVWEQQSVVETVQNQKHAAEKSAIIKHSKMAASQKADISYLSNIAADSGDNPDSSSATAIDRVINQKMSEAEKPPGYIKVLADLLGNQNDKTDDSHKYSEIFSYFKDGKSIFAIGHVNLGTIKIKSKSRKKHFKHYVKEIIFNKNPKIYPSLDKLKEDVQLKIDIGTADIKFENFYVTEIKYNESAALYEVKSPQDIEEKTNLPITIEHLKPNASFIKKISLGSGYF